VGAHALVVDADVNAYEVPLMDQLADVYVDDAHREYADAHALVLRVDGHEHDAL
jgi:hypothetical protein